MKKLLINIALFIFCLSAANAQPVNDISIGVVYSALTKQLVYPDNNQFNPIQDWELFFLNRKIHYTVFTDDDLDDNDFTEVDVLILPSVEVLSEDSKENLTEFINEGKGLLIFGKMGTYDVNGKKNRENFISSLCGFSAYALNSNGRIAESVSINDDSFLANGIPFGSSLTVMNRFTPLFAKGGKFLSQAEYQPDKKSAVVSVEKNNGRIVWFGFQLSQISGDKSKEKIVEKIIFNSIEWLSGKPVFQLAQWQVKNKTPVLISNLIVDLNKVSKDVLNELYELNLKSNFFIDFSSLKNSGVNLTKLAALGDINLNIDLFGLDNNGKDLSEVSHVIYKKFEKHSRQKYFGIRIENLFGNLSYDEITPFNFYTIYDEAVYVSASKNNCKRLNLPLEFIDLAKFRTGDVVDEVKPALKDAKANNKILFLRLINQKSFAINIDMIKAVSSLLKNENVKLFTYSELITSLNERENIVITVNGTEKEKEFLVTVENRNQQSVKDLLIEFYPSVKYFSPEIADVSVKMEYDESSGKYFITVPYLQAGMKTIFRVKFKKKNE